MADEARRLANTRRFIENHLTMKTKPYDPVLGHPEEKEPTAGCSDSHWGHITYHEYDQKLQDKEAKFNDMFITANLSDPYRRPKGPDILNIDDVDPKKMTMESYYCRRSFAQGHFNEIRLSYKHNGDVWIAVGMSRTCFVKSLYLDTMAEPTPRRQLHIVYPGGIVRIYHFGLVKKTMYDMVRQANNAKAYLAGYSTQQDELFKNKSDCEVRSMAKLDVKKLKLYCGVQIAMGEEGRKAETRVNMEESPCWVHVTIKQAEEYLAELLATDEDDEKETEVEEDKKGADKKDANEVKEDEKKADKKETEVKEDEKEADKKKTDDVKKDKKEADEEKKDEKEEAVEQKVDEKKIKEMTGKNNKKQNEK